MITVDLVDLPGLGALYDLVNDLTLPVAICGVLALRLVGEQARGAELRQLVKVHDLSELADDKFGWPPSLK